MTALLPDMPSAEVQVVEMTNRVRAEQKLASVTPNPQLTAAARAYAAFLAKSRTFSHTADGREAGERITASGYEWCQVGENLALAQSSNGFATKELAEKAVEGWLNSPGHRRNLLQEHVTEIGVGIAKAADGDPKYITVQLFGRPKSAMFEFQVSNASDTAIHYTFAGERNDLKPSFAASHVACLPSEIEFENARGGLDVKAVSARFEAADGIVYVVKSAGRGRLQVEATPKKRVR
ncbi:MAG: CAP domain-containing protein [Hyphomicrobium sp.]